MNNDIDLDKLTEIARQTPTVPHTKLFLAEEEKRANSIVRFCATYSIKNGIQRVKNSDIFRLYKKWEQDHSAQRLTRIDFFRLFSKMFKGGRNGKSRYYLLSVSTDNF